MAQPKPLSLSAIRHLTSLIRQSLEDQPLQVSSKRVRQQLAKQQESVSKEEAKELLARFVLDVRKDRSVPKDILEHVANAFDRYLNHDQRLERGLGLTAARRGRQTNSQEKDQKIAISILQDYLGGTSLTKAFEQTNKTPRQRVAKSANELKKIWRAHKQIAFFAIRAERTSPGKEWSVQELQRLKRIGLLIN